MKYLDIAIANEQIKTTEIKGKDYAEVNQRIKAFRMVYPDGTIETEMLSNENGICIFKASIYKPEYDKKAAGLGVTLCECKRLIATGYAYEKEDSNFINQSSYIENCETSAVGRALGMAGFGIDVSVASAEEVANAMQNQEPTKVEADSYVLTFGKYKDKKINEVPDTYIDWLIGNTKDERLLKIIELATGKKIPTEEEAQERLELMTDINNLVLETDTDYEDIYKQYGIESIKELNIKQLKDCKKILERKRENE